MDYVYLAIAFALGYATSMLVREWKNQPVQSKPRPSASRIMQPKTLAGKVAHYINSIDEQDYRNCRLHIRVLGYGVTIRPRENDHVPFRDIMRDVEAEAEKLDTVIAKAANEYSIGLELVYEVSGTRYSVSDSVNPADMSSKDEIITAILESADDLAVSIKRKIPK